jgi:hypothetical protein
MHGKRAEQDGDVCGSVAWIVSPGDGVAVGTGRCGRQLHRLRGPGGDGTAEEYSNLQGLGVAASCPFCSCWTLSEGFEGPGGVPGVVPAGGGDAGVPGRFQDADGQVAQGGHGLGSAAAADLGGVFAVADVAEVVIGPLPDRPCMHLDHGYDSRKTRDLLEILGYYDEVAVKGVPAPIQPGKRWPVERTHSWMNGYGKLRRFTDKRKIIVEFYLYLAATPTVIRRLINQARSRYRRPTRPTTRRLR